MRLRSRGKMQVMSVAAADLETPVLLLAMPQVLDPFFHQAVVLLVHHDAEGSVGFIVNRPTELAIEDILEGMEIHWQGATDATAFFGGPVQSQMGTILFRDQDVVDGRMYGATTTEVQPGVRIGQQLEDLDRLANDPPRHFRLLLGYAGWGAGQLIDEIVRNDWLTAPVSEDLLFSDNPEEVWESALRSVGVDPASLPSWTTPDDEETAN
jgi:putative transcriptional regulator